MVITIDPFKNGYIDDNNSYDRQFSENEEQLGSIFSNLFKKQEGGSVVGNFLRSNSDKLVQAGTQIVANKVSKPRTASSPQTSFIEPLPDTQYRGRENEEKKSDDKTLLYVGIAAAGVLAIGAIVLLATRPQQPTQMPLQQQPQQLAPQLAGVD